MEQALSQAAGMDRIYRYQRHIYDATRKYFLLGRDPLISALAPPKGGHVLEIGCGTARNLVVAARRYPQAKFYGIDISAQMLATADHKLKSAGLADRVRLAEADATAFDSEALFGHARFERVYCSYCLSMIPDWRGTLKLALDHVAPGGELQIVDFGQQDGLPSLWRLALFAWLSRFHVTPRPDLHSAMLELAGSKVTVEMTALHRGYSWLFKMRKG